MIDMNKFTLTQHDKELLDMIKPVKHYSKEHKILAQWTIDSLNRILPMFSKKYPHEIILNQALNMLLSWMNDEIKMWDARKYTYTVLALARHMEKFDKPYAQIVRATAHSLATCHVPTHAEGCQMYIISALRLIHSEKPDVIQLMQSERQWQIDHLHQLLNQK